MNKLVIPSILAATVLVGGVFAFMPIDKASTVHNTILQNRVVSNAVSLDGLTVGELIVVMDLTTPGEAVELHIAATLPSNDSTNVSCDDAGDRADDGISLFVGNAPADLADIVDATPELQVTGIEAGTIDLNGDGDVTDEGEVLCVYHVTIAEGATLAGVARNTLTDVAVANGMGVNFPDAGFITVTAQVKD